MRLPRIRTVLFLMFPALVVMAGCDRNAPASSVPATSATPPSASAPLAGVVPQKEGVPAASDRPEAPAIGAIEAGKAGGGAAVGKPAEPTGGDGAASAPASAPASGK